MLKIKSFLFALCLSPLPLAAFQLPVSAQSQGTAGSFSGVASTGGAAVFVSPAVTNGNNRGTTVTITAGQNASANLVINALGSTAPISLTLISTPLAAIPTPVLAASNAFVAAIPTTGTSSTQVGSATVTTTPGTTTGTVTTGTTITATSSGPGGGALGNITAPTTTAAGSVTVKGITVAIPATATAAQATQATQAAIAILLAGGSANQAAAAATIAGTGAGVNASVKLIQSMSSVLAFLALSADPLVPNLNASLLKSFDTNKGLLIAQKRGQSVDPAALAAAIIAYNEVLDTSSPEVVAELSKNEAFIEIGETLRKLRTVFGD
jgi:hypothetical protein